MPWKKTVPMDEKIKFMEMYLKAEWSLSMLCREFEISRKTGYKLIGRYLESGEGGLEEQSRAARHHPNSILEEVEKIIIAVRESHMTWGPCKLLSWLQRHHPGIKWPSASTIGAILKRYGLIVPRRLNRRGPPYAKPFIDCYLPNDIWSADFKGWFYTGDGARCDPFTLEDSYSRYLLRCQVVLHPDYDGVKPLFEAAFREYGLPSAIRTDNGAPFATTTLGGLSRLSIWWIRLGIIPERIRPGKPSENGRHERMHRTLKQETATPPRENLRAQQRAFDRFREEYNYDRPHEAIKQQPPATLYCPSSKSYPLRLPEMIYPDDYLVRKVHSQGDIRWKNHQIYLSQTLAGENIGLRPQTDVLWDIYFGSILLARLDERLNLIIRKIKK